MEMNRIKKAYPKSAHVSASVVCVVAITEKRETGFGFLKRLPNLLSKVELYPALKERQWSLNRDIALWNSVRKKILATESRMSSRRANPESEFAGNGYNNIGKKN